MYSPMTGTSAAAQFLVAHMTPEFISTKTWCHVDIAYPSFSGERATGFGVALVNEYLSHKFAQ